MDWLTSTWRASPLSGVGLLALAETDIATKILSTHGDTVPYKIWPLNYLLMMPGQYKLRDTAGVNKGEYPACAAMTTGYVFRVENEAMVHFLQRVGRPGQLITVSVKPRKHLDESIPAATEQTRVKCLSADQRPPRFNSLKLVQLYLATFSCSIIFVTVSWSDLVGLLAFFLLWLAGAVNLALFKRRTKLGWKGQKEPGVRSDLLVLLSQDRWIRIKGFTDDVKAVTSGQWARDPYAWEDLVYALTNLLGHLGAALLFTAQRSTQAGFLLYVLVNTVLTHSIYACSLWAMLYERTIEISGARKAYKRRLDMAKELVDEVGNDSWCEKMGIILTSDAKGPQGTGSGPAHM